MEDGEAAYRPSKKIYSFIQVNDDGTARSKGIKSPVLHLAETRQAAQTSEQLTNDASLEPGAMRESPAKAPSRVVSQCKRCKRPANKIKRQYD